MSESGIQQEQGCADNTRGGESLRVREAEMGRRAESLVSSLSEGKIQRGKEETISVTGRSDFLLSANMPEDPTDSQTTLD